MCDFCEESSETGAVPAAAATSCSILTEPRAAILSPTWRPHAEAGIAVRRYVGPWHWPIPRDFFYKREKYVKNHQGSLQEGLASKMNQKSHEALGWGLVPQRGWTLSKVRVPDSSGAVSLWARDDKTEHFFVHHVELVLGRREGVGLWWLHCFGKLFVSASVWGLTAPLLF